MFTFSLPWYSMLMHSFILGLCRAANLNFQRLEKKSAHKALGKLVGDVGFEPTTHCSQSSCATGLR